MPSLHSAVGSCCLLFCTASIPLLADEVTKIGSIQFTMADSLAIEKIAHDDLIHWPVVMDWDQQGRLVVVESGGVGWPIEEHNQKRLHRVVRLADDDGDGHFDRRIVAADALPFTEGVLCLGNSMLVAAPPHIWKLTDRDGDGRCEEREIWFDGQTLTNCANYLHGPYMGRDGWIYWCKGAFGEQTHDLADGRTLHDQAAHIFRRRPEGGPIELVISGGMDNPVEVATIPTGDQFFTSTFLQHPSDGRRDGIGHAVYGAVFGKDHHVVDDLVRTGPLAPIMTHLGPAAPSGLICLFQNSLLPADNATTLVSAQFNLQKVAQHSLVPSGSGFVTLDRDLLVANRVDFHPTDILEDSDGSLIVCDTGGWYDLCCPTSRVDQRVAAGGLYRITSKTTQKNRRRLALRGADDASVARIIDPRPFVRRSQLLEIQADPDEHIADIEAQLRDPRRTVDEKINLLWALSVANTNDALRVVEDIAFASRKSPQLSEVALRILGLHRQRNTTPTIIDRLEDDSMRIRRVAAMAAGRTGEARLIDSLLRTADMQLDYWLEHAVVYALIELGDADALAHSYASCSPQQRRVVLAALGALSATHQLDREWVADDLTGKDPQLSLLAAQSLADQPAWADQSLHELNDLWDATWRSPGAQTSDAGRSLFAILRGWHDNEQVKQLAADWIRSATSLTDQITFLASAWDGSAIPASWISPLQSQLRHSPEEVLPALKSLQLNRAECQPLIEELRATMRHSDVALARQILPLLPGKFPTDDRRLVQRLMDNQDYRLLAKITLSEDDVEQLLAAMKTEVTSKLPALIETIALSGNPRQQTLMLTQLPNIPAARTLGPNFLGNLFRSESQKLLAVAKATDEQLALPPQAIRGELAGRLKQLPAGDPVRGLQVYRDPKAACIACHQMGYIGGRIGPELTRIGQSRTREALLEAILFPSSRIEQSFQPEKILTIDGQVINGLVTEEDGRSITMQTAADKQVKLLQADVQRRLPSAISIMPSGMSEVLTDQEIADLLALLESAR